MTGYTSLKGEDLCWQADINTVGALHGWSEEAESGDGNSEENQDFSLGQERGVEAFRFGMAMNSRGYNIFVTGPSVLNGGGSGGAARIDTLGIVKNLLQQGVAEKETQVPDDICYVHNFAKADEPMLLRFAAGTAVKFKEDLRAFVDSVMRELPPLFESPEYTTTKNQIIELHERKTRDFFKKLEVRVRDAGFAVINMQMGGVQRPDIAPLIDGEPVLMIKLEELQEKGRFPQEELELLKTTYAKLKDEIDAIFLEVRDVQREVKRKMYAVDSMLFQNAARELAQDIFLRYNDAKVQVFMEAVLRHMTENLVSLHKLAVESVESPRAQGAESIGVSDAVQENIMESEGKEDLGDVGHNEVQEQVTLRDLYTLQSQKSLKGQSNGTTGSAGQEAKQRPPHPQQLLALREESQSNRILQAYDVNILVDNSTLTGPPIIIESYPTYRNLFGSIDRRMEQNGSQRAKQGDYRKIHAGSFIKANGGYLVLNLMDAIMEAGVWTTLKRALKNESMEIQTYDPYYFILSPSIKPEAIEMSVKVIVLATPQVYHLLRHHDEDVARIFKVWADFDASMARDDAAMHHVCHVMQGIVQDVKLLPFAPSAVAALLERGVRLAGRREKISIAFPQLRDMMEEANYMAKLRIAKQAKNDNDGQAIEQANEFEVIAEDVQATIEARRHRAGQVEEKLQEMIDRGTILIDTKGLVIGQVNGLAVMSMGHHLFGKPTRITATTSMGKVGIVNIEREAELSGALHNKGMLILMGYINRMFAQKRPLTFSASIAFEQSYGGVDGDSASSTEVYALLSSLSGVPIKQGIAVTGSVNQKGEVQAIGGVNEKVEGFYDCCVQHGLTGEQGVLIPYANRLDLMLEERVVSAVDRGEFHIWAVKNICEGIEILTGLPSGVTECDGEEIGESMGNYAEGSVFSLVDARLESMAQAFRDFQGDSASA